MGENQQSVVFRANQRGSAYKAVAPSLGAQFLNELPPPSSRPKPSLATISTSLPGMARMDASVPKMPAMPAAFGRSDAYMLLNSHLPTEKTPNLKSGFTSKFDKVETLQFVVKGCKEMFIRDVSSEEEIGRVHGTFYAADHEATDFHISLYSMDDEGSTRIFAQIMNGSGCRIAFSQFMCQLIKILRRQDVVDRSEVCASFWDPRICPPLPTLESMESEDARLERLRNRVNSCLDDCESGFARTIAEDAPQLARFSEDEQSRIVLKRIPHILERLIKLMEPSFECVLVRSVLVCLLNLCDGDENLLRECRSMSERLTNLGKRWSRKQYPFGEEFPHSVVESSREIVFQVDRAIRKLA